MQSLAIAAILILLGAAVMGWWFAWDANGAALAALADADDLRGRNTEYAKRNGELTEKLEGVIRRGFVNHECSRMASERIAGLLVERDAAEARAKKLDDELAGARRLQREVESERDSDRRSKQNDLDRLTAKVKELAASVGDAVAADLATARHAAEMAGLRGRLASLRECAGDARRSLECALEA